MDSGSRDHEPVSGPDHLHIGVFRDFRRFRAADSHIAVSLMNNSEVLLLRHLLGIPRENCYRSLRGLSRWTVVRCNSGPVDIDISEFRSDSLLLLELFLTDTMLVGRGRRPHGRDGRNRIGAGRDGVGGEGDGRGEGGGGREVVNKKAVKR